MPSFEESTQALVDGLFAQDQETRLLSIRRIKNAIIGNPSKKSSFMLLGVIPRMVSLLGDEQSRVDIVCEAVIALGSFAHGTPENVQAVLDAKALPLLIQGLCSSESSIVGASIRTVRTLFQSGRAPADAIFEDQAVVKRLVQLISHSPLIGQCAAIVLAKTCQNQEQQNTLCAHGVVDILAPCILSCVPKLVHASIQCLSSVVYENMLSANVVVEATCNGQLLVSVIAKVLSGYHTNETKLAAAQSLTYLVRAGAISYDSSIITLKCSDLAAPYELFAETGKNSKMCESSLEQSSVSTKTALAERTHQRVLPTLVRLCRKKFDSHVRAEAATALGYLTRDSVELQELAANSDRLISTLVEYLHNRPDENDDLVQDKDFQLYDQLRKSAFLALASLASTREEIRMRVVSEKHLMKYLPEAINGDHSGVKLAAARCLHSLSRSTKLLRTSIVDAEVWKPILEMLSIPDGEHLTVATSVVCNLLLAFSPSREKLVESGAIEALCVLTAHENSEIQVNAIWALMSAAYESTLEIKSKIRQSLPLERLIEFLVPSSEQKLLIKSLGLMVNLMQKAKEADSIISEHGPSILNCFVTLLQHDPSNEVAEQVMCVLVNFASASTKSRDAVIHCDDVMTIIAKVLRNNDNMSLLMATCAVVKHLADHAVSDYIHRQNCLDEYGIKMAVQKLEMTDHSGLQDLVRNILDNFTSITV